MVCLHLSNARKHDKDPERQATSQKNTLHSLINKTQRHCAVYPKRHTIVPFFAVVSHRCTMTDTENLPPRRSTRLRPGTTASSTTTNTTSPLETSKPSVSPLRISKSNSKSKTLSTVTEDTSLRDISPGSSRRNSPSTFQIKEKMAAIQTSVNKNPPTSPPLGMSKSENTNSVRNFWAKGASTDESAEQKRKTEAEDLKSLRSSYVKNNIFLANDMRERESSPKLTMSPSQHRLSAQLGEETTPTASPSKIPAPVDASQSARKDTRPATSPAVDVTPKASCLHSNRIKGPRQNASDPDSPTLVISHHERRKTVTFDEAPQVLQFDRRSSHGTTCSEHSSATYDDSEPQHKSEKAQFDKPLPAVPPRPLPQVPPHSSDDDRPSSKESNESDYGDMEERIRSMMERVVVRDTSKESESNDQEDIFSLYTTTNEMEDDSQESAIFSSQGTASTGLSSQVNSQDEELERQLALQKQSEELLQVVKSRPFSLAELPDLGFGDEADEDLGGGLGLREFCSPEPLEKPQLPPSASAQASDLAVTEKFQPLNQDSETFTPPITPPLESSEIEPQTPQEQIIPPPETLPTTPPSSPHKSSAAEEEDTVPSPVVPEREATIRSRGGSKLRVRPSLSRQEAESIIARRRKSELPPLPDLRETSVEPDVKVKIEEDEDLSEFGGKLRTARIDLPVLNLGFEKDVGGNRFGELAVEEMERVIEAQKVRCI